MSTRGLKRPLKAYARDPRRKKVYLDVDLNDAPPYENRELEGTSSSANSQNAEGSVIHSDGRLLNCPIEVEDLDDELIISSPRRFAAARNLFRRRNNDRNRSGNLVTVVLDDDLDTQEGHSGTSAEEPVTRLTLGDYRNQGRSSNSSQVCRIIINLDKQKDVVVPSPSPPPPAVPKEPVFSCAICMGPLVEEHSTICGHIFCKQCIKAAISAQKRCPTCRRNLRSNNIHRVYLPTTN